MKFYLFVFLLSSVGFSYASEDLIYSSSDRTPSSFAPLGTVKKYTFSKFVSEEQIKLYSLDLKFWESKNHEALAASDYEHYERIDNSIRKIESEKGIKSPEVLDYGHFMQAIRKDILMLSIERRLKKIGEASGVYTPEQTESSIKVGDEPVVSSLNPVDEISSSDSVKGFSEFEENQDLVDFD